MRTLREQLDRLIKRKGEQDPLVQMLRNQIIAEESGKTFRELYASRAEPTAQPTYGPSGLSPLPIVGRRPQGFLVEDEDLLPAFQDVLQGLTSKRKSKRFHSSVDALASQIDESVIADVGDRVGDGLPIDYVRMHISDQGMADMLGLDDEDLERLTQADKVKFARERMKSLQCDTDADICPGFWLVPITDGQSVFYLGYSITGYSFSGIEWKDEGAFLTKEDFVSHVCCQREMLFEDHLCMKGKATSVDQLSDSALLRHLWGR